MNDILEWREPMAALSGNISIEIDLKVPLGFSGRLWDFRVYNQGGNNIRYGIALYRTPVTPARAWTTDAEILNDGQILARLMFRDNFNTNGRSVQFFPHTAPLWELDYRVVTPLRIGGFAQASQNIGFSLRYRLEKLPKAQLAAILAWQNQALQEA